MRFLSISQFLLLLFVISFSSCNWLDKEVSLASDNPNFISLTFKYDKNNPGISTRRFTIEKDVAFPDDSIIVNLDSLPYNTRIDSVVPIFQFYSHADTYLHVTRESGEIDVLHISNSTKPDTIDFRWGVTVRNVAAAGKPEVKYVVKLNVHKVEAELYTWKKAMTSLYDFSAISQKAISFRDSIFFFASTASNTSLYKSKEGYVWSEKINVSDLPASAVTRNIVKFNNSLYYAHHDQNLYASSNGSNWVKNSFAGEEYEIVNLLFELNSKLWAISKSKDDATYRFAFSTDAVNWTISSEIPINFPISDYAAHSFATRNHKAKAIVVGGYNSDEVLLKTVWSTENGSYWIDFSKENSKLNPLAGASILSYDNKLFMYGLMNAEGELGDDWYAQSVDEGFSWQKPDSIYNSMQEIVITGSGSSLDTSYINIQPRYQASVVTDKDKRIVLIGGRDKFSFFSDVWVGKLNRLNFDRQ